MSDFKSITIPFGKANQDVKEKLKDIVEKTGKTKVDIINEAIRQYALKNNDMSNGNINKDDVKGMVKESLLEILLQNQFNGSIQVKQNIEQPIPIERKSKEDIEQEKLNRLNSKKVTMDLLEDD